MPPSPSRKKLFVLLPWLQRFDGPFPVWRDADRHHGAFEPLIGIAFKDESFGQPAILSRGEEGGNGLQAREEE
jgi:hypothetical protein